MLIKDMKYSYNDITIVPAPITTVEHRADCNPFLNDGMLPIFTAPMSSVVCEENFELFEANKINAILPRSYSFDKRKEYALKGKWAAFSLQEFENNFVEKFDNEVAPKVLIDIANGHMQKLYDLVRQTKDNWGEKNIIIMIGNIANPLTYKEVVECGADFVRVSVGSGMGCITSSNTSIHYPLASLVQETYLIKRQISEQMGVSLDALPKIIADGGVRNYSDVIKALALGADYAMIGGIFSALVESAAKMYFNDKEVLPLSRHKVVEHNGIFTITDKENGKLYSANELKKRFYGMASKQGQIDMYGAKQKTAEGIVRYINVTTNLNKWVENMIAYLQSAMSYTNIFRVSDFDTVTTVVISTNTYVSVNK
jgi:hypothetical protein